MRGMRVFLLGLLSGIFFTGAFFLGGAAERLGWLKILDRWLPSRASVSPAAYLEQKILKEESAVIKVVERAAPSVVTVSIQKTEKVPFLSLDPLGFFGFQTKERRVEQDIGSGFVVEKGLVVTNKHVVKELGASYKVIGKDNKVYPVEAIYRDPANDLAILKIKADLPPLPLGDSDRVKVGQMAIAMGTALGEFRQTVTVGVISGLGRGIMAGSVFEGYVERLDNVIQTDAAINPGNSGGPLLNSAGQVIGVNVAVAQGAENIGFAIPINVVKESLKIFKETGEFERLSLGVAYQMISKKAALLNEVPAGALVRGVRPGSPAAKAGLQEGDIIVKVNEEKVADFRGGLAALINRHRVGETVEIKYWREGKFYTIKVELESREDVVK